MATNDIKENVTVHKFFKKKIEFTTQTSNENILNTYPTLKKKIVAFNDKYSMCIHIRSENYTFLHVPKLLY